MSLVELLISWRCRVQLTWDIKKSTVQHLKLHYNKVFMIDKVNKKSLYAGPDMGSSMLLACLNHTRRAVSTSGWIEMGCLLFFLYWPVPCSTFAFFQDC